MILIKQYRNRFFITSAYNNELHSIIRTFKGRYWDDVDKIWKISNDHFDEFISKLKESKLEYQLDEYNEVATITEKGDQLELELNFYFKEFRLLNELEGCKYEDRKWTMPLNQMDKLDQILKDHNITINLIKEQKKKILKRS
mgnify:CR=1 FL=1